MNYSILYPIISDMLNILIEVSLVYDYITLYILKLSGLATWQVLYLRKYFKSKKLIE